MSEYLPAGPDARDARPARPPSDGADVDARRFGGVARLYGAAALERFGRARVGIIGMGGVGTWAAEALARSGAGRLRLVDLDHVAVSNTNRQIHALETEFGKAKVAAMAERIALIHPQAQVEAIEDFATPENAAALVAGLDVLVDCVDQVAAKAALIAEARGQGIAVVTCGGAGGRKDPARIRHDDLARTHGDPLLAAVRQRLRHRYGFAGVGSGGPRRPARFGVTAVFSDETFQGAATAAAGSPLACGGYGSAVTVTATMGLAAAACVLAHLAAEP